MEDDKNVLIVIPSRYASTRLPGKALLNIHGKTLVQRVYEQCSELSSIARIVIATDDKRIEDHARSLGAEVFMTSKNHKSGTDRCAEVASLLPNYQFIVNVQGDEAFIDPDDIRLLIKNLEGNPLSICTLANEHRNDVQLDKPSLVKLVKDIDNKVLYFSRYKIPYGQNGSPYFSHVGMYGYPRDILLKISTLPQSALEISESLEQLRWLENGYDIRAFISSSNFFGVDTIEDLERARQMAKSRE
jgi:3-deoxy-manno-octulosonate cytidylyltransferase (CMP-KDO synthetase)